MSEFKLTSDGQVSEEEPSRDERLLGVAGRLLHDVQVWGVKAEGSGRETVCDQVHPQQLHWDQCLRETESSGEKNTAKKK